MSESVFSKPPPTGDHEPPPKPKRFWLKFSLAAVMIVCVSAAATSTSILLYIGSYAHALSHNNVYKNKLDNQLAKVRRRAGDDPDPRLGQAGEPQRRPGRSDTTMLLRLDPEQDAMAVLSIPRDLEVEIPGYGTEKLDNTPTAAPSWAEGHEKELTGLEINHVVNVDFLGFVRAVDAIKCVYVDGTLYHNNAESCKEMWRRKHPARLPAALQGKRRCSTSATGTPTPTSPPGASRTS